MIKLTVIAVILICAPVFMSQEPGYNTCMNSTNANDTCIKVYINNDFSYRPFGQDHFTEKDLLDSIFKDVYREKCESGIGDENTKYSYSFYTDKAMNSYTFVKLASSDTYVIVNAAIKSQNTNLHVRFGSQRIDIDYTKEKVAEIFKIENNHFCDSLKITDDEGSSMHILYFERDLLKRIKIQNLFN